MIRIVKMTFEEEKITDFLIFFDTIKSVVNNFPGCNGMQLLRDIHSPNIIFTYSNWEKEENLENYRTSSEFQGIWTTIKPWFSEKAQAWSVDTHFNGFLER